MRSNRYENLGLEENVKLVIVKFSVHRRLVSRFTSVQLF